MKVIQYIYSTSKDVLAVGILQTTAYHPPKVRCVQNRIKHRNRIILLNDLEKRYLELAGNRFHPVLGMLFCCELIALLISACLILTTPAYLTSISLGLIASIDLLIYFPFKTFKMNDRRLLDLLTSDILDRYDPANLEAMADLYRTRENGGCDLSAVRNFLDRERYALLLALNPVSEMEDSLEQVYR